MIKKIASGSLFMGAIALFGTAINAQDFPILDKIADKVIQKYQQSTCEQLWEERAQKGKAPKPQMEQEALQMLKSDPQMRAAFINKVAAPIANKMFECGAFLREPKPSWSPTRFHHQVRGHSPETGQAPSDHVG